MTLEQTLADLDPDFPLWWEYIGQHQDFIGRAIFPEREAGNDNAE